MKRKVREAFLATLGVEPLTASLLKAWLDTEKFHAGDCVRVTIEKLRPVARIPKQKVGRRKHGAS